MNEWSFIILGVLNLATLYLVRDLFQRLESLKARITQLDYVEDIDTSPGRHSAPPPSPPGDTQVIQVVDTGERG